ncbi:hypothetical protein PROFUN_09037 [Planoprotostelium fungivorum]|uniref:Peptide N-acetyl-beta-D-glucosaminyl asparaginase amidase A N-terminal domain-containing protein n=1 Tax=Planoprotostelium fungivorum TaxID=1890364 RepID=A0A2P6MV02_9EUKA|nr:hypothetical protein PROFUN_09037 [Planoprotostelium fungivorum]
MPMMRSHLLIIFCCLCSSIALELDQPYRDFQVKVPPLTSSEDVPEVCIVTLLSEHPFRDGQSALFDYSPPTTCSPSTSFSRIQLNITATVNGTQYDRLGLVFLHDVEIWRYSSSEPTKKGIIWSTIKDVTRYRALFSQEGKMNVLLGNVVEGPYNGIFRVTVTATFFPETDEEVPSIFQPTPHLFHQVRTPDVFLPLSGPGGNALSVGSNSVPASQMLTVPRNALSAWMEIYASGNGNEEFWYTNVIDAVAPTFQSIGRGPFREVQLYIDGQLAGTVFPYAVIYTGGINPLLWRPSASYGSYDQPTYYIDVTPFLGTLTDDAPHNFTLTVRGMGQNSSIDDNWFLTGNLQVYLSSCEERTTGEMKEYEPGPDTLTPEVLYRFQNNKTAASVRVATTRSLSISAEITSCGNTVEVRYEQYSEYTNFMTISNMGNNQYVDQLTFSKIRSTHGGKMVYRGDFVYPITVNTSYISYGGNNGTILAIVNHGMNSQSNLPMTEEQVEIVFQQDGNGSFTLQNGIGVSGTGGQNLVFVYRDSNERSYSRYLEVEQNKIKSDLAFGTLKDIPSGFSPQEVDESDSRPFSSFTPRFIRGDLRP